METYHPGQGLPRHHIAADDPGVDLDPATDGVVEVNRLAQELALVGGQAGLLRRGRWRHRRSSQASQAFGVIQAGDGQLVWVSEVAQSVAAPLVSE